MKHLFSHFRGLILIALLFSLPSAMWGAAAPKGTVLWGETFESTTDAGADVALSKYDYSGRTCYGADITYTVDDASNVVWSNTSATGVSGCNLWLKKQKQKAFTTRAIDLGGATRVSFEFIRSKGAMIVSWKDVSGSEWNVIYNKPNPTSNVSTASPIEFDIPNGVTSIIIKIQEGNNSNNLRVDNIALKVVTAGKEDPVALTVPANLSSSNVTTNSATLLWDAVANASSYTVNIGKTEHTGITTTSYSATGLSSNTEYTWTVKAVGDGTNYTTSDYADSKSFTTLAPATAHTVTFNVGTNGSFKEGEEFVNDNQRIEASAGAGVALPEVVANTGYVFGGWSAANPATSTYVAVGDDGKYHPADNVTLNAYYKVIPATPNFSVEAGEVEKGTEVTISCTTDGATIYYTTNGDDPTSSSSVYSSAIALTTDQTIKAIAVKEDVSSSVASATYTIATHTARFSINGTIADANNCTVAKGEAITFPVNPADIEDFKFLGWTKIQNYSDAKNAPSDLCNSATMGTNDVTFYAVYASGEEGEPTLTKLGSNATFAAGDKIVIIAKDVVNGVTSYYGMYHETVNSSYVNYFKLTNIPAVDDISSDAKRYWVLSAGGSTGTWHLGDATNGYLYNSSNNMYTNGTVEQASDYTIAWNTNNSAFTIKQGTRWVACRKDLTEDNKYLYRGAGTSSSPASSSGVYSIGYLDIYKYASGEPTYSNYCTSVVVREISSIEVKTAPATVAYCEGEKFNPAGLEITINYTEGDPEYIAYAGNETKFSFSPALDAELTADDNQVTITYKDNSCQQAINVRTVSISAPTTVEGTYTVKVGDAEAVTADGNTIAAKKGQKIVLASTANPGYRVQSTPFVVKDEKNVDVSVSTAGGQYSFTMPDKDVTITAKYSKLYTLTAAATTNGSIAIKWNNTTVTEAVKGNKIVIEVSPAEHYYLSSLYYVKEGEETQNTIRKTDEVYSFTMEDANTTIYATFAEDEKHEAIFYVNGEESSRAYVYTGENVVFPETNPDDLGGKVFRGWASAQIVGTQAEAPTFANETGVTMENADIPFYAVFATATGSSTDYSYTLDTSTSPYNSDGYQNGEKKVTATCPTDNTKTFDVTYQITNFGRVSGQLQMKKSGDGYMYNTTDLGSITSVTIDDGSNLTTYYGSSQNPQSGTSVGTGNGYFRIVAGSTAGTCSSITVTFTQSDYTYSAYCTTVAGELSLVAQNNENGTIYYYATFSSEYDVEFEDDVVYTVTVSDDQMTLNQVNGNQVPANTGVLIKATATEVSYKYIAEATALPDNMLKPGTGGMTEGDKCRFYRLAYYDYANETGLGFYYGSGCPNGEPFKCKAGTAYLAVPKDMVSGNAPARFLLGRQDVPTDLLNVNDNNQSTKVMIDGRLYILRDGKTYDSFGRLVK